MNLFKKGILALGVSLLVVACNDEYEAIQPMDSSNGPGLSEISFSSFSVSAGANEDGLDDGTFVSVTPLAIGATSFVVDFGNGDTVTINENGASASYDYPNTNTQSTYVITVTAKSNGLADVSKSQNFTVTHTPNRPTSAPDSPSVLDENVYSVFSNGTQSDGAFSAYTNSISADLDSSTSSEYNQREVGDTGNDVIQYSRLQSPNVATISFDSAVSVADVFGTGAAADYFHLDLHSIHAIGIDHVKITMGGHIVEQALADDTWTGLTLDLAAEGITQIDDITLELASGGTASAEATLNVDNVIFYREPLSVASFTLDDNAKDYDVTFTNVSEDATSYHWDFGDGTTSTDENPTHSYTNDGAESTYRVTLTTTNFRNNTTIVTGDVLVGEEGPIVPVINYGDFNGGSSTIYGPWKIANNGGGDGSRSPFGNTSDGACQNYDGSDNGGKTKGAKYSSSYSANADGSPIAGKTRYAYQAVILSPNTDYIFEYSYAIKTGGNATNKVVASILNGHYSDVIVALASNALIKNEGTVANGAFKDNSCTSGTIERLQFRSNAVGEVSILFYAVTNKDAYIDNVKIYPAD